MDDRQWQHLQGDPDVLGAHAAKYTTVADAIERSTTGLQAITNESESISDAVDALRDLAGKVRDDISKAQGRYKDTGAALTAYSTTLRSAKDSGDHAADELARLRDELATKKAQVARAESDQASAKGARDGAKSDTTTTDAKLQQLNDAVTSAGTALGARHAEQAAIESDIAKWEGVWNTAHTDKVQAGNTAQQAIHDATNGPRANGLNNTWWDKVSGILDDIGTIVGIAALLLAWVPILGEVLAVAAVVITLVKLIGDTAAYGFNLGNTLLGLASCLPFGLGKLSKLGKISKLLNVGKLGKSGNPAIRAVAKAMTTGSTKFSSPMANFLKFTGNGKEARAYQALLNITSKTNRVGAMRPIVNQFAHQTVAIYGGSVAMTGLTTYTTIRDDVKKK